MSHNHEIDQMIKEPSLYNITAKMAIMVFFTICSLYVIKNSLFHKFPLWFWVAPHKHLPLWWLFIPMCILLFVCVTLLVRRTLRTPTLLLLFIIIGAVFQHGFALMEGRGIDGIRDRILITGHAEFARAAVSHDRMLIVALKYYDMVEAGELAHYPHSTKPPGQLMFYMGTERLSQLLPCTRTSRLYCLANFASFFWPLISSLTIIPLYIISRMYFNVQQSFIPCIIYISTPSVVLITLHLDQCLYPLLFTSSIASTIYAVNSNKKVFQVLAGVFSGMSIFVSFSLAVVIFFSIIIILFSFLRCFIHDLKRKIVFAKELIINYSIHIIFYLLGMFLFLGILFATLNFDPLKSFQYSMSIHQSWKIENWTLSISALFGFLGLLEFAIWSGMPSVLLAVYAVGKSSTWSFSSDEISFQILWPFTIFLLALAFLGKTAGETARLWLFLVPFITFQASVGLSVAFGRHVWLTVYAVTFLQLVNTFGIKMWQDFY